jgi:hypothetical protein
MRKDISIGEKYMPAMGITEQAAADAYFEECVRHCMVHFGKTRAEAEQIEKNNIGYFAGYYSREVRAQVERLFKCAHPYFGTVDQSPSIETIFQMGVELGRQRSIDAKKHS